MKQVIQSLKNGTIQILDVPVPCASNGTLLINTKHTLISAGTERMLLEFGKAGWIEKARQQPDKVRLVLKKIKTDGLQPTLQAVHNKLEQPFASGYCNVGRVLEIGMKVNGYKIGDRVISNGKHAEVVNVPTNLCAKVPDKVSDEEAVFTVLGAIALQGVRLLRPTLGEAIVVMGLGLVGLLTVQILRANGCRVLGLDFDETKIKIAKEFGAETILLNKGYDPINAAISFSRGRGVDGVIITAATKSNEPVHHAAQMCRKRGRIILVGVTGLELSRNDFFEKELTFQVSASYGPGRYDRNYEEKGEDYPLGFVRWTAQRNFEAVLDMMDSGALKVKPLISHRFPINDVEKAYRIIEESQSSLGILLQYPGIDLTDETRSIQLKKNDQLFLRSDTSALPISIPKVSFIGSGNYASAVLIPSFKQAGVRLQSIASKNGVTSVHAGKKFGFYKSTTDSDTIFSDLNTDIVVISTLHDSHAHFVLKALNAKKHIFVEKPLCLTLEELDKIKNTYSKLCLNNKTNSFLMIGYNRRFAPHIQKIKSLLEGVSEPKSFIMTINAGFIPSDHWSQDPLIGGGRIIGEACHFIDLLRFLADSPIQSWSRSMMNSSTKDTLTINLNFKDGSIGTIHYFANGNKSFPKERLEVFSGQRILQLDNYRRLKAFGWTNFSKMNLWNQDKGQKSCVKHFIQALQQGCPQPIPLQEIFETTQVAIEISQCKTS
jgi:predicted dehydrogenase/threonine dehydrogenase-like Zn-dependent dehydrogenase